MAFLRPTTNNGHQRRFKIEIERKRFQWDSTEFDQKLVGSAGIFLGASQSERDKWAPPIYIELNLKQALL